jgi:hypothetical protein
VEISCIPNPGFRFVKWLGGQADGFKCSVNTDSDTVKLMAVLVKDEDIKPGSIIINEIMYKPSDNNDCRDWIELLNNSDMPVDLVGWEIKDDNDGHIFNLPFGSMVLPGEYLVVSEDTNMFRKYYNFNLNLSGNIDFGFGRDDVVRLYDSAGKLMDSVDYSNIQPWDSNADGTGYSLELIEPGNDNSIAVSWRASGIMGGTPGMANSKGLGIENTSANVITLKCYPNPADETCTIQFMLNNNSLVYAGLYNILGNKVIDIINGEYYVEGSYKINLDLFAPEPGIYYLKLNTAGIGWGSVVLPIIKK